jgi:hypothetical protein
MRQCNGGFNCDDEKCECDLDYYVTKLAGIEKKAKLLLLEAKQIFDEVIPDGEFYSLDFTVSRHSNNEVETKCSLFNGRDFVEGEDLGDKFNKIRNSVSVKK